MGFLLDGEHLLAAACAPGLLHGGVQEVEEMGVVFHAERFE